MLAYGGFKLTKWLSNSEEVIKNIPEEDHLKVTRNSAIPPVTAKERILGFSWCVIKDEFFFEIDLPKVPATKKGILSVTNSLYDPLGFVLPVVLRARLLYSEVCQAGLGWDQILDEAYRKRWVTWSNELINLKLVRIPRYLKPIGVNPPQIQLHFFADASALARGAVCYLRAISQGVVTCSLVMAKSHVCTPGKNTIPRLELEAALDAAKL